MEMVALFAGTALLLAGLGIYGTISFLVNEQSREIAIRVALGAQRRDILRMVLRQGLTLAAVAIAASYVPALRAMRLDPIATLHSE
jgi:ABC-type antimicrobial peptide transport system permease subunit